MTQAVELPLAAPPRAAETKLVWSVCFAHFVSHYYILLLAPLFIFVREDYGVSYTELGLGVDRLPCGLDRAADAGRLPGRPLERALHADRGLLIGACAFAIAGLVNSFWVFVAMFALAGLGNTVYHPADYALAGTARPVRARGAHLLLSHLRRHARQRGGAGDAGLSAHHDGLAQRFPGGAALGVVAADLCRC